MRSSRSSSSLAVNKSLEEAMKALDTREEISIDLEQRDLNLKQQTGNRQGHEHQARSA